MAVTSSGRSEISGASYQGSTVFYCNFSATFSETEVDTANNTSKIYWSAKADFDSNNGYSFSGTTRDKAGVMKIYLKYGSSWTLAGSKDVPLDSGSYPGYRLRTYTGTSSAITHNADGTKTVKCEVDISSGNDPLNGGYVWSSVDGNSKDLTLTAIPRASTPSINTWPTSNNTFELGSTITIHMNRASDSFTHDVTFYYGLNNNRSVTVGTGVTNNCTLDTGGNLAATFLADNPNSSQLTGKIRVITKKDGTEIGRKEIAYTATIPSSYNPIVSQPTMTESSSLGVGDLTIVRYLSEKTVGITAVPQGSASISRVSVSDGKNVWTMMATGNNNYTADISNIESGTITFTVIDSRGKTVTYGIPNTTLVEYSKPTIITARMERTNSSTGEDSALLANGSYYQGTIGTTTNAVTIKYLLSGSPAEVTIPSSAIAYSGNNWSLDGNIGTLSVMDSFTAVMTVTDAFNQSVSLNLSIPSIHNALWVGKHTVRAHEYLIADTDVWLNDGTVKLSDLTSVKTNATNAINKLNPTEYSYDKTHNNDYNTWYIIVYKVTGSGFIFAHQTVQSSDSESDYGYISSSIDRLRNGSEVEFADSTWRKSSSGFVKGDHAADAGAMIKVQNNDQIKFYSGKSFDASVRCRVQILAFGCTLTKISG